MRGVAAFLAVALSLSTAHAQSSPDEPKPSETTPAAAAHAPEPAPAAAPAPPPAAAPATVVPAEPTPASAPSDEEVLPNPSKTWGWIFGGAALASWLVAAGTGGAALGKSSAQEGSVANPKVYTQNDKNDGNTGNTLATVAYVFMGVGAALTIVDAVIWYECLRKPRTIKRNTAPAAARIEWSPAGVRF
jgi:hypothetical protein